MTLLLAKIKRNAERLKAEGARRNEDPEIIGCLCAYGSNTWKEAALWSAAADWTAGKRWRKRWIEYPIERVFPPFLKRPA